jgi:cAMP-binding proteins - catabolite gene activator and regulatory subunit of cAMP-dependent protein kinases
MELGSYFPIWDKLTEKEKNMLTESAVMRTAVKGDILHNGSADCVGLFIVRSGQLRAYLESDEGKEITLYRLFERDICLFSASCMISDIQFDIYIEAEDDTSLWIIPTDIYKQLMTGSAAVANYTNQVMASRFSEVMWLIEQIMWKSFDKRLAAFLLEESTITGSTEIRLTHEKIASHLGTAREVVTRMLKYFSSEGLVTLSRGVIELKDPDTLRLISQ